MDEIKYGYSYDIANFVPDIREAARASNGYVLEIGIGKGDGSTIAIQEGLAAHPDPLHISVDIEDGLQVYRPNTPWWHLVVGDSAKETTRDRVRQITPRTPGLIFIDTHHVYEQMQAELSVWPLLAGPETVWLFHDTWMFSCFNEGMVRAIQEFADKNGWVYDDFKPEPHGLGRMRRA